MWTIEANVNRITANNITITEYSIEYRSILNITYINVHLKQREAVFERDEKVGWELINRFEEL